MDDLLSSTPVGGDTISKETDNSTLSEWDPKNDGVILAQPTMEKPITPLIPSIEDPPCDAENPSTQDS